jgi:hypothetical protein
MKPEFLVNGSERPREKAITTASLIWNMTPGLTKNVRKRTNLEEES